MWEYDPKRDMKDNMSALQAKVEKSRSALKGESLCFQEGRATSADQPREQRRAANSIAYDRSWAARPWPQVCVSTAVRTERTGTRTASRARRGAIANFHAITGPREEFRDVARAAAMTPGPLPARCFPVIRRWTTMRWQCCWSTPSVFMVH